MPPPKKKLKMTETNRSPNDFVSFEQFKKLVENLSDICFEVQRDRVAGEGSKTLDECAHWYYEYFYRDPAVRKKYPCRLRACPMKIRDKLLRMPESKKVGEPEPVSGHQAQWVMVKVAKNGTFLFPVSFSVFESCIDVEQVLRVMGKTPEQRQKLLADEKLWQAKLKRFYNMFYMFPDRPAANIFRNVSLLLLSQLLKHGKPHDDISERSVAKHAAEKKRPSIVSFAVFERNLSNIYDIVWQLKLHDKNYAALDFEKCAQALYLAFYLKLEIRDKYTFKWRTSNPAMIKRLLTVPNEEEANELRRSMPHLDPHTPEMELEEVIEIPDSQPEEPGPTADILSERTPHSLPEEPRPTADNLSERTPEENNNNSLEKQPDASEPTLITTQGVAYEYPVTCDCFLQFVNSDEVLLQIRATHNATILSRSDRDLMQGLYLSFYTNKAIRKQFKVSFNAAPPALREKLLAMAKPVIQSENQEVTNVNQPENQERPPQEGVHTSSEEFPFLFLEESSQSSEEEPFQTDVEVNVGKDGRFLYPVSFDTFRRCINYNEIILPVLMLAVKDKSQLAGLVTHPRNPLCEKIFRRYYRSFYIFRDVREKYPYRFSCSDSSVLKKLVEYAKPLDENGIRTLEQAKTKWEKATNVVDAQQSKKDKATEDGAGRVKAKAATVLVQKSQSLKHLETEKFKKSESEECNDQRREESKEKSTNRPPLPVTFHVFKRYVKNFNEILQKMQLCNEYKGKSEAELTEEYYKGFYTSPEMRQKFECKFRPCPAKKRDLLFSYAQKPQLEASSQESEVDVELVPKVGLDNCNNLVEKGRKEAIPVEPISVPVEESKGAADKEESSPESDCDVCLDNCNNIVEKGSKEAASLPTIPVEPISVPVEESREAADKEESLQESEFDVEFIPDVCSNNCNNVEVTESKEATKYPEKPTSFPVEQIIDATETEEKRVKEKSVNPVSFQIFKRYVSNLKEIVNQMLLCDGYKEMSEEECARDYYNGFYSSQEMRDRFPYQLKPCPAQMRNKLLSFPKKEREDQPREEDNQNGGISAEKQSEQCAPASGSEEIILITESEDVEMAPCDIPVHTEKPSPQNQTTNNPQQTEAALNQKSRKNPSNVSKRKNIKTFKDGGSFEFPVSYETFKRHINYDEIIKRLLQADSNNECEQPADRGQRLFQQFFNSFYVQKNVRKSHPYRFENADAELLKKLEEYAVPLNEVAKLTMSSQAPEGEGQPWTVPSVPKDDTLVILAGITYRFPVTFQTFHRYINYDELKVGLAQGPGPAKKSPEQLAAILADETSCLRLLRSYYYSFYTLKIIRNKLKYNFRAAPPELAEKLLEFAKPIDEAAEPTSQPHLEPQPQPKQGVPVVTGQPPVTLSVFLNFMDLEEVVRGMQQEPEYSKLEADECKLRFYQEFYSNPSIRDKYPFKLRPCPTKVRDRLLTLPPQSVDPSVNRNPDEMYASREAELAGKQRINVVSYRPCDLRQYIDRRIAMPGKQDLLERHILDSRIPMNAAKNTPSPKESPESMSKSTDSVAEVETSAGPVKVPKESQSVKSSNLVSAPNEKTKEQAKASREPSKPNSEKPLENTQNKPKSSADLPRPPTSSSTLRVKEQTNNNRKENEPKKCSELEDRTNPTSKKNKEANATKESPTVTKELTAVNSTKDNKAKKNSVQVSASERSASTTPPAEASRNVNLPDSAQTQNNTQNNPKSSAVMPGPSTSSSTLRVTDEIQAKRKENEAKKCSELEERTNSTSNKNKEATTTKESQRVTKKVAEANSTKEKQAQKSSEQVSVTKDTSSTTSKKNDVKKTTNKPPAEASKTLRLPDSANLTKSKPNNPKNSSDIQEPATSGSVQNPEKSQDKRGAPTKEGTGTNSGASSKSAPRPSTPQRQTEREIILEQAKAEFFAESTKDHNMTYLICTSQGLKRAVWRILYQLTLEEFKTYTSIHNGEDLYRNEEDLQPYYQHVVDKGNWPINLYIRLPMLRQLLHSKGVQLGTLDLRQLSPKMLHWRELDEHTDLDKIVEMQFKERTGEEIDSVEQWFKERERFYAACWRHDQWVYEVPQITNEALRDEVLDGELPHLDGIVLKPLHIVESCDLNSQTEILSFTSSSDMVPDSQSCPPTQLSTPNFVDIASVDIQSQVPETPLDPLASQPEKLISVKQEPIKFLNNLRGICNTDECHWEHIASEEQIVNLDTSQEEAPSLSCFAIPKPSEWISPNHSLDALLTATMFEDEEPQPGKNASNESIELPEHPAEEAQEPEEPVVKLEKPDEESAVSETNVNPATRKKKLPASNAVPSKRVRLGNEKVPQLRHEFRPLPLNACVRIETDMLGTDDPPTEAPPDTAMPQPEKPPTEAPPSPATLTPSQDFALGNTILESSQLTALLDALPRSTSVRKVNEKKPANENRVRVTAPTPRVVPPPRVIPPPLRTNVIFRKLERFLFFNPLTNQHIGRYMIQVPLQGTTYQSAMLKVDGRMCQVQGPLLETLFPHLSPLLRSDLARVLRDMPEFVYSCRWWRVLQDNTEDLRKRVLYAFMHMAPEFGQFRLQFDDREWATCIEIGRWDFEVPEKRPRCSNVAEKVIRPGILEKMREFKDMLR